MKTSLIYTNSRLYINRNEPYINLLIDAHSKSLEQAEYYGEDTSMNTNDIYYSMGIDFPRITKGIRIQDKLGFLMEDSNSVNKDKVGLDFIKYKGIYFSKQNYYQELPDDIYVKIYNSETGELIKSFNKLGVVFNQAIKLKIVGMEYKKEYEN